MEQLQTRRGSVTIVPVCPAETIRKLRIDRGLGFFWHSRPDLQHDALIRIASEPEGRVAIAHAADDVIVGYVTITLPDADTRWGRDHIEGLVELGGIEVSRNWRGARIARALLSAVLHEDDFDDKIVIATGYQWCWDLESTGLTGLEYRDMLNRVFGDYGFELYETDEPNIAWYPDNALVARVGSRAPAKLQAAFKALLFERPGSDYGPIRFAR